MDKLEELLNGIEEEFGTIEEAFEYAINDYIFLASLLMDIIGNKDIEITVNGAKADFGSWAILDMLKDHEDMAKRWNLELRNTVVKKL